MKYLYAHKQNYAHYASGKIFRSYAGRPAFPVRLASEILQRALAIYRERGGDTGCTVYDPCCGGGYLLGVLGYLYGEKIKRLIGSDIDGEAVHLAESNLALLTPAGLARREHEIETMLVRYRKESHRAALSSLAHFRERQAQLQQLGLPDSYIFQADATDRLRLVGEFAGLNLRADIILTDVPYGDQTAWQAGVGPANTTIQRMLAALRPVLSASAVLAIAAEKQQQIIHNRYKRLKRLRIGRRQVVFLVPEDGSPKMAGDGDNSPQNDERPNVSPDQPHHSQPEHR